MHSIISCSRVLFLWVHFVKLTTVEFSLSQLIKYLHRRLTVGLTHLSEASIFDDLGMSVNISHTALIKKERLFPEHLTLVYLLQTKLNSAHAAVRSLFLLLFPLFLMH